MPQLKLQSFLDEPQENKHAAHKIGEISCFIQVSPEESFFFSCL